MKGRIISYTRSCEIMAKDYDTLYPLMRMNYQGLYGPSIIGTSIFKLPEIGDAIATECNMAGEHDIIWAQSTYHGAWWAAEYESQMVMN